MRVKWRLTGPTGTQKKKKKIAEKIHFWSWICCTKTRLWWEKSTNHSCFSECFQTVQDNALGFEGRNVKERDGKARPRTNLISSLNKRLIQGLMGLRRGAAVSDVLWGNSSVLGMRSHAKVSWRAFEPIPSSSSLSSLHFTPRLGSTRWWRFKKYAVGFFFLTLTEALMVLNTHIQTCPHAQSPNTHRFVYCNNTVTQMGTQRIQF